MDELTKRASDSATRFAELSQTIKDAEKRMAEIAVLKPHIINYSKTKDVYVAYRKAGYSKQFFEAHREEILLHKAAKEAFGQLEAGVPKIKDLNREYPAFCVLRQSLCLHKTLANVATTVGLALYGNA